MQVLTAAFSLAAAATLAAAPSRAAASAQGERQPEQLPRLRFNEEVRPGELTVLVLDAYTGAPLHDARVVTSNPGLPAASTDSAGIARLRIGLDGAVALRVLRIGYFRWRDSVVVSRATGRAMIVQLRQDSTTLIPVLPSAPRRPPDGTSEPTGDRVLSRDVRPHRAGASGIPLIRAGSRS